MKAKKKPARKAIVGGRTSRMATKADVTESTDWCERNIIAERDERRAAHAGVVARLTAFSVRLDGLEHRALPPPMPHEERLRAVEDSRAAMAAYVDVIGSNLDVVTRRIDRLEKPHAVIAADTFSDHGVGVAGSGEPRAFNVARSLAEILSRLSALESRAAPWWSRAAARVRAWL